MKTPTLLQLVVAFFLAALLFGVLERAFRAVPQRSVFCRERMTDYVYWLFNPIVTHALSSGVLAVVALTAAKTFHLPHTVKDFFAFTQAHSMFREHPPGLQMIEALLITDGLGYWTHRMFHRGCLWRFHAIHHSATALDWLASTRFHPMNEILGKLMTTLPVLFLGFDFKVFGSIVPLLGFYAVLGHANVRWDFGPLRYVVASPRFHRWHHTSAAEGREKNFAAFFPLYDLIFGTFYMPSGKQPEEFGVKGEAVPPGFWAQLAYPFRRSS
jgi:sterol desaturase/sphingolipid hydroxylase (fatty acid hydroxylase superfamily)